MLLSRFQGGGTWLSKRELVEQFTERFRHDREKWIDLSEGMKLDLGKEVSSGEVPTHLDEWARHTSVKNRGVYAAWTHCLAVC